MISCQMDSIIELIKKHDKLKEIQGKIISMVEVLNDIHKILDIHYEQLKTNNNWPIRAKKGDGSNYPLGWTEICGSLLHKYALIYNNHILFDGLPGFDTDNYI